MANTLPLWLPLPVSSQMEYLFGCLAFATSRELCDRVAHALFSIPMYSVPDRFGFLVFLDIFSVVPEEMLCLFSGSSR